MSFKENAGFVSTSGNIIYQQDGLERKNGECVVVRFLNTSNYVLTLEKYTAATRKLRVVYELTLTGGKLINDTTKYKLAPGDYLKATSDIAGTSFFIQVEDASDN